jgi:hypothetical protein
VREPGGPLDRGFLCYVKEKTMSRGLFLFAGLALAFWFAAPSATYAQVERAGAYYNPYTGASAAGRAGYNPYTGTAGREVSGYNPVTGRDVSEKQVYNPYTGRGAEVRTSTNPYTGRTAYGAAYRR